MTANKMPPNPTPSYQSDKPARANKMPEMPSALDEVAVFVSLRGEDQAASYHVPADDYCTIAEAKNYGRACYLAGIEAARACVPAELACLDFYDQWESGHNRCREETLTNLTALEQEAKK